MDEPKAQPPQQSGPNRTVVLFLASLAGFLVTFLMSAVNIALPLIEEEFHVSAVILGWMSLSYILVAGATLLPAGRLADLYGRVRLFIWGMIVFTVISFASAFAPSAGILLALRSVQGVGLALGAATSTALVILAYPPESRGRALGLNVAGVYLGLTLGPVLGGIIIHNLGWRGLFLVVGALGLANVGLSSWKLRHVEWREPKRARFDVLGSVVYAVSLSAVLLGFSLVPDVAGVILIVAGVVGLAGFLWWETRAADPLLHVDLLRRNRVFAFSNAAAFINYSATFAMVFLMSLYLQYNRGLNPQTAGFVLVSGTFLQAVLSPVAGRLTDRVKPRYVASTGMTVCVLGLFALSFVGTATPYWYIIAMLCVLGVGFAFFSTPITHTVMSSVDRQSVGVASATLATMRMAGISMSLGIATLVLALEVGRQAIQPADYPQLLSSVRLSFLIFTGLCVCGVAASLVGPRRRDDRAGQ
jgi:EmrB/QacA subfamily drug resistance transporter